MVIRWHRTEKWESLWGRRLSARWRIWRTATRTGALSAALRGGAGSSLDSLLECQGLAAAVSEVKGFCRRNLHLTEEKRKTVLARRSIAQKSKRVDQGTDGTFASNPTLPDRLKRNFRGEGKDCLMADELTPESPESLPRKSEQVDRLNDLLRLLPHGAESILEIGSRHGVHTRALANHFQSVTALDLTLPAVRGERITAVQGDVTALQFPANSFDCVLCAEVLEHVPALKKAASEIARVCRGTAVIGVPYRQDTRLGRTTCRQCGHKNPPYGHVNTFDENKLRSLFGTMAVAEISFVGAVRERTNALSVWLNDLGGNPWGTYMQEEPCGRCGARLAAPEGRSFLQKACSGLGGRFNAIQQRFNTPQPAWIHVRFTKNGG